MVAAIANNNVGGVGVAYGSYFFHSPTDPTGTSDVVQSSNGGASVPRISLNTGIGFDAQLSAEIGRDGAGTIWVNSAGNGGTSDVSTEVFSTSSTFEVLLVAQGSAITGQAIGSTFGSAIHVTGLTGHSQSRESILTTDLQGEDGVVSADDAPLFLEIWSNKASVSQF